MDLKRSFEADAQLAEVGKPGNDVPLVQVLPTRCKVVALVGVQFDGAASVAATEARHARNSVDECLEHHRIVASPVTLQVHHQACRL